MTVVIGAQWGDEGKGKIVDALAGDFDVIGRFNGGNNAGHTIIYNNSAVKLHVLPSGIFQNKQLLISQGAVFDPEVLLTELKLCKTLKVKPKLTIDNRTNLVMPYHKLFDGAHENWKGKNATGSVRVGIGYCYEDRNNRSGIRCEDLFYPKILQQKIATLWPLKKAILEKVYGVKTDLTAQSIFERIKYLSKYIKPFVGDVRDFVLKNLNSKKFLWEGAMATMLDASFGSYPYTVANNTFASSIFASLGIPEMPLNVIGVVKAYTTRVGGGPFPTEQKNKWGRILQTKGKEIAATSGRIRRCGWLDLPILNYASEINHFSCLALTKLDVLSDFTDIPVNSVYKFKKQKLKTYPGISHDFYKCKPEYVKLKGWQTDITRINRYHDLPQAAKNYIQFIEKSAGIPVKYISVGPERQSLFIKN